MCMRLLQQVRMIMVMVVAVELVVLQCCRCADDYNTTTPMIPKSSSLTPPQSKPSVAPSFTPRTPMAAPPCTVQQPRAALSSSPASRAPAAALHRCHVTGPRHWHLLCGGGDVECVRACVCGYDAKEAAFAVDRSSGRWEGACWTGCCCGGCNYGVCVVC